MLENDRLIKDILIGFANYSVYVAECGKTGFFDTNKAAEGFVAPLLNELCGWELELVDTVNYPGIDLLDRKNRIGVQISSDKSTDKINETLQTVVSKKLDQFIDELYFFFLLPKQKKYTLKLNLVAVKFSIGKNVLDFDFLIKKVHSANMNKLQAAARIVREFLPHLYREKAEFLKFSKSEIEDNLNFLDRAVFNQLLRYEDPFRMLKAIREIRIHLQRNGAKRLSNELASKEFSSICAVLQNCENSVKDEFPVLWDCVIREVPPTSEEQQKGEFWKALGMMMDIRKEIEDSVREIVDELGKINSQLNQ